MFDFFRGNRLFAVLFLVMALAIAGAAFAVTFGDDITFENNTTFQGTEAHSGTETHTGSVTFSSGTVTFSGTTALGGTPTVTGGTISGGSVSATTSILGGTNAQLLISNGTSFQKKSLSGDATITNAGVISIGSNKVGTAETFVNTITVTVAGSGTSGTGTVTSGSTILGYYPFANVSDSTADIANKVSISSTTLTVKLIGAATEALQYKVVVLEP